MGPVSKGGDASVLLSCHGLHRWFGGVSALDGVSMRIMRGEIFGLVGPNGSGKTTLVNVITGFYPPQRGRVEFEGRDITGIRPHRVTSLRIVRTFQNIALFRGMSVLDNILLGRHVYMRPGALRTALYWWLARKEEVAHRRVVEDIIDFLQLESVRLDPVDVLPIGLQKRVELARALAAEPKLLILDEPMAGMNMEEKEYMARFVLDVHYERGVSVIMIEHQLDVVMGICDRMAVLNYGEKIAEGVPREVVSAPDVVKAYTGLRRSDA
ncbi:MAG: ABC transporter ATP-binding protein [Proteobacteria bacterium]|nr:ABC transporter ATP-binding protein [Pseudomonadota bacterium]